MHTSVLPIYVELKGSGEPINGTEKAKLLLEWAYLPKNIN